MQDTLEQVDDSAAVFPVYQQQARLHPYRGSLLSLLETSYPGTNEALRASKGLIDRRADGKAKQNAAAFEMDA